MTLLIENTRIGKVDECTVVLCVSCEPDPCLNQLLATWREEEQKERGKRHTDPAENRPTT